MAEVDRLNGYAKIPEDILMDLIMRKTKPHLCEMMAPFNKITEYNAWEKKLISCGNSIEQNDRVYKNTNHQLDQYHNNNNHDNNNCDNSTRDNNDRDNDNRRK